MHLTKQAVELVRDDRVIATATKLDGLWMIKAEIKHDRVVIVRSIQFITRPLHVWY